jgi:tetratricopeptide (TPR) repeat protein
MDENQSIFSVMARQAVQKRDWATVNRCAEDLLKLNSESAEGYFLRGLFNKAADRPAKAFEAFAAALKYDAGRYDAAIELANQHCIARRNGEAAELLGEYEKMLGNSPLYLDLAGTVYSDIGMPERAWPLHKKASELQPGVDLFLANLASSSVYIGEIEEGKAAYEKLLRKYPAHQRNHYSLSRLEKARDATHVKQMLKILSSNGLRPEQNVFMYFAIGKELEDLENWDDAFYHYKLGGDAVASVADYDVNSDLKIIDKMIEVCNHDWIHSGSDEVASSANQKTPIFIVGLPRTGTTLTERIIASHSQVQSVGETEFVQMVIRRESGIPSVEKMTPEMIEVMAGKDINLISQGYIDAVSYKLGDEPLFIEKLPFNFLYLGFIAKAFPNAKIVSLKRNPMDACFALYKQVFTWAYKYSYTLDTLGQYYVAYDRILNHWRELLGARLIEVEYETLVSDQEAQTRRVLDNLGLEFEEDCLHFDKNKTASTTASSVQVRQKIHTGSVNRWRRFEEQLAPLRDYLVNAGIDTG